MSSTQQPTGSERWSEVRNGAPANQTLGVTNDATVWYCYTTHSSDETITIYKRPDGEKVIHITSTRNPATLTLLGTNLHRPENVFEDVVENYEASDEDNIVSFFAKASEIADKITRDSDDIHEYFPE